MQVVRERAAGLDYIAVRAADEVPIRQIVVMCHGYGAPGDDLVGLAPDFFDGAPQHLMAAEFVFPAAPISLEWEFGFEGRAWWPINMVQLQQMALQGDLTDLETYVPPELAYCRQCIEELAVVRQRAHGLNAGRWIIGGFSQGAMLAVDVALRGETGPAALIVFSGTVICRDQWQALATRRSPLRVVQSHGTLDPILPYSGGERLRDLLRGAGHEVKFLPFAGPHTISPEAIQAAAEIVARSIID